MAANFTERALWLILAAVGTVVLVCAFLVLRLWLQDRIWRWEDRRDARKAAESIHPVDPGDSSDTDPRLPFR